VHARPLRGDTRPTDALVVALGAECAQVWVNRRRPVIGHHPSMRVEPIMRVGFASRPSMRWASRSPTMATVIPGPFFCGVHFLRKRKSSTLFGVGEDAAIVAQSIVRNRSEQAVAAGSRHPTCPPQSRHPET
jgi:hypothetical protein